MGDGSYREFEAAVQSIKLQQVSWQIKTNVLATGIRILRFTLFSPCGELKLRLFDNNRSPELRNRKMYRYDPVDVHLDMILSVLAGGGSRSGPAVSFFLKLARPHCLFYTPTA